MTKIWFKRIWGGWCEVPISWEGWALSLVFVVANLWYFSRVDSMSHSISDTLIGLAPFFIATYVAFAVVARFTSE